MAYINLEEGDGWAVDEHRVIFYTCEECGYEMGFMGNDVCCESCGGHMANVPDHMVEKFQGE